MDLELLVRRANGNKNQSVREVILKLARQGTYLIDEYFSEHPDSDVAFILEGALDYHYMIFNYSNRNIILFTPASSYQIKMRTQSCDGKFIPEHAILLFDSDMLSGDTIRQAKEFFVDKGYEEEKMFVYLHLGLMFQSREPQLRQVDDMLRYRDACWPKELPKIRKPYPAGEYSVL